MKVFLSWSGKRSGTIAEALRQWLPYLFQSIEPWMSSTDIEAGARWNNELQEQLAITGFGVIALTRDNLASPWLLFEAGALAKAVGESLVTPYLIDLAWSDMPSGPLTQFQAKSADRQGTWDLVRSINGALKETGREIGQLDRIFERWWPDLEESLSSVRDDLAEDKAMRPLPEMVEDILLTVRGLERQLSAGMWGTRFGRSLLPSLSRQVCDYSVLGSTLEPEFWMMRVDELSEEERNTIQQIYNRVRTERVHRQDEKLERSPDRELAESKVKGE